MCFQMAAGGGKSKGPPPAVKKLLSLFGRKREEDRMVGYLSFLKVEPKIFARYTTTGVNPTAFCC